MSNYLFALDQKRPSRRFICPACGKREFKRYQHTVNGDLFQADNVGRCNREINCGYHYPPRQYFIDYPTLDTGHDLYRPCPVSSIPKSKTEAFSTIPISAFQGSMSGYSKNCFTIYLNQLFGTELAAQLIKRFAIGTAKTWPGASVFWQIDDLENVRAGKIMLYNPENGKRVKKPFNHVQWVHSVLHLPAFQLKQCLFGLHQIRLYGNDNPVCIVESEKTAILMTAILPDYIWLATGGLKNLNPEICAVLKKREIRLYPDLGCFSHWSKAADEMRMAGFNVQVSDLLESKAGNADRLAGFDLADYFIRPDLDFGWALTEENYPLFWDR